MRLGPARAVRLLVLAVAVDALLTAVLGSDETGRFLSGETDGSALLGGAGLALLVVLCLLLWRAVREVTVRGRGALATLLSLITIGDFATCYVGLRHGEDPTPVKAIQGLKAALAAAETAPDPG